MEGDGRRDGSGEQTTFAQAAGARAQMIIHGVLITRARLWARTHVDWERQTAAGVFNRPPGSRRNYEQHTPAA